jgi:hypothetical protein
MFLELNHFSTHVRLGLKDGQTTSSDTFGVLAGDELGSDHHGGCDDIYLIPTLQARGNRLDSS